MKINSSEPKVCKYCGEDSYSDTLTNGLCLNCYNREKEEYRQADIEAEHDYYEGSMGV